MTFFDILAFVVLPYIAVGQLIPAAFWYAWRARDEGAALEPALADERRAWYWTGAWAALLLVVLLHLGATFVPGLWSALVKSHARLLAVEFAGLIAGLVALFGLASALRRRIHAPGDSPLRSSLDVAALALLVLSALAGVLTALQVRWGAAWYPHVITPWLWSLAKMSPDAKALSGAPGLVQAHVVFGFLALALAPFTSLPRQLVAPLRRRPAAAAVGGAR